MVYCRNRSDSVKECNWTRNCLK